MLHIYQYLRTYTSIRWLQKLCGVIGLIDFEDRRQISYLIQWPNILQIYSGHIGIYDHRTNCVEWTIDPQNNPFISCKKINRLFICSSLAKKK